MLEKKIKITAITFLLIFILALLLTGNLIRQEVCFEEKCFKVEKVNTPSEREKGLMFRYSLDENKGMLFVFENESIYSFWMKNTYIPLDMIWINEGKQVVFVFKNTTPCKEICPPITPLSNAKYVLEINAGLADKYDINIGDEARIK